ncbi:MAG: hypothetical protein KKC19_00930 [Nanoarchaeota archaeon]|nr:hypothetical protein [Nanoarchaeota archaeon]
MEFKSPNRNNIEKGDLVAHVMWDKLRTFEGFASLDLGLSEIAFNFSEKVKARAEINYDNLIVLKRDGTYLVGKNVRIDSTYGISQLNW